MANGWNLDEGVLLEKVPDNSRMILWLPRPPQGRRRTWERVSEVLQSRFTVQPGYFGASATSFLATQIHGSLLSVIARLWGRMGGESWLVPTGQRAKQTGERQNNLLLVWTDDPARRINEPWLLSRWPASSRR